MSFESQIVEIEIPNFSDGCFIIDDPQIVSMLRKDQSDQFSVLTIHEDNNNISSNEPEEPLAVPEAKASEESSTFSCNEQIKPRKRLRKSANWKITKRQKNFQAGLEFTNYRGDVRPKKEIVNLKNCMTTCKLQCAYRVSDAERTATFEAYYSMDQAGKYNFIASTTERTKTRRKSKKGLASRRSHTFKYFFNVYNNKVPVCKNFYLGTLAIPQKPIYTVHEKINLVTGTMPKSERGTKTSRAIGTDRLNFVMDHIKSFPCIESHYCREKTKKKYLDSNLNILKMYDLYVQRCNELEVLPVKESFYRNTFNTRFNLDFYKPKSDRCSVCELNKIDSSRLKEGEFDHHIAFKSTMREIKEADKKSGIAILCFDMQKVITCPKSNIDSSYYLSKLNIDNLTAHLSTTRTTYCAMWNEAAMGRTGNDIASALYKILARVFNDNDITALITWSDSCVPQNKNSYISYAIQHFLQKHPQISSIEMRFSLPGHSCIQEVDNAHSQIEKVMSRNEFFSPIGLIRLMKTINRKKPYIVIQMKPDDFKNFEIPARNFNYKTVPFAAVRMLGFCRNIHTVKFNLTYLPSSWQEVSIRPSLKRTRVSKKPRKTTEIHSHDPPTNAIKKPMPANKILDLQKMFRYMGSQDLEFYKTILKTKN